MVPKEDQFLLRSNRSMSYTHQYFAMKASNANIGPVSFFNLVMEELTGSRWTSSVGCTKTNFKNYQRDVCSLIGDKDAQIEKFNVKKEVYPCFSFEFESGEDGKLKGIFWADETYKLNYEAFGDVVSFDSTFNYNKYNMVFVPFTGIDNHHKCVIFAAALLSKEDIPHYSFVAQSIYIYLSSRALLYSNRSRCCNEADCWGCLQNC